jgi:hypothetical protein
MIRWVTARQSARRLMKYAINMPTSLSAAIKEIGPFIVGNKLGKRFKSYDGLLLREVLGNWLLCAILNDQCATPGRYTFTTEPKGGGADGAILDKTTGLAMATEHVMATRWRDGKLVEKVEEGADQLVAEAILHKKSKGPRYGTDKILVVYLEANVAGYSPRAIREHLPPDTAFADVLVVVPQGGLWEYDVIHASSTFADPPTYRVSISKDFDDWKVEPLPWPPTTAGNG